MPGALETKFAITHHRTLRHRYDPSAVVTQAGSGLVLKIVSVLPAYPGIPSDEHVNYHCELIDNGGDSKHEIGSTIVVSADMVDNDAWFTFERYEKPICKKCERPAGEWMFGSNADGWECMGECHRDTVYVVDGELASSHLDDL